MRYRKNVDTERPTRELADHILALGLGSLEQYREWCRSNGFSPRFAKNWKALARERYFADRDVIQSRLARKKAERRRPRDTIRRIVAGELDASDLTAPHLLLIHETAASLDDDEPARNAFLQLLRRVEGRTKLLTAQPALSRFGERVGNTFIDALSVLARSHENWLRPVDAWKPRSRNAMKQFASLADHLLANYPIPGFMQSVWFLGAAEEAKRRQNWYVALGSGVGPRKLDLPIRLTKRMASRFLKVPRDCSFDEALRLANVLGLGGSPRLARAILGSRIGTDFENQEFWETVIQWFVKNPMLDPVQVAPLIDYIHMRKFEPREPAEDGGATQLRPVDPGFSMRRRSVDTLMRQMRAWHVRLRKEPKREERNWPEAGFGGFDFTEGVLASNNLQHWTIRELLSRGELYQEGRIMRHCVASYDNSCAFGKSSIWSMGVERNHGRRKRVLTLEVANAERSICQIRGKANREPTLKELSIVKRWAAAERLTIST